MTASCSTLGESYIARMRLSTSASFVSTDAILSDVCRPPSSLVSLACAFRGVEAKLRASSRGTAACVRAGCRRAAGALRVDVDKNARRPPGCRSMKSHNWHSDRDWARSGRLPGFMAFDESLVVRPSVRAETDAGYVWLRAERQERATVTECSKTNTQPRHSHRAESREQAVGDQQPLTTP